MRIRPATGGDRPFVLCLVPSFVAFGLPAGRDAGAHAARFGALLSEAIESGGGVFVAEDGEGGAPLGFVHLRVGTDLGGGSYAEVADIAVDAGAQGSGVGRALMAFAERRAAASGQDRLTLSAFATNERAVRFYERLGYEPDVLQLTKRLP